jgi:hypothetical protein
VSREAVPTSKGFSGWAGSWHMITLLVIVLSLATQLVMVVRGIDVLVPEGPPPSVLTRVLRFLSYFTVQSNILVALSVLPLMRNPATDDRAWRVLRLDALIGIAVTGVVFVVALRPIVDLSGLSAVTNVGFHYVSPLLAVIGWLLFGPRPRIDTSTLGWALAWPLAWLAYTLVHGAISGWYPYPFIDAGDLGYLITLINAVVITVLMVGVGALFLVADHRLPPKPEAASVLSNVAVTDRG